MLRTVIPLKNLVATRCPRAPSPPQHCAPAPSRNSAPPPPSPTLRRPVPLYYLYLYYLEPFLHIPKGHLRRNPPHFGSETLLRLAERPPSGDLRNFLQWQTEREMQEQELAIRQGFHPRSGPIPLNQPSQSIASNSGLHAVCVVYHRSQICTVRASLAPPPPNMYYIL